MTGLVERVGVDADAQPGRAGWHMSVGTARDRRQALRDLIGRAQDPLPTVVEMLEAATILSELLGDASKDRLKLTCKTGMGVVEPTLVWPQVLAGAMQRQARLKLAIANGDVDEPVQGVGGT